MEEPKENQEQNKDLINSQPQESASLQQKSLELNQIISTVPLYNILTTDDPAVYMYAKEQLQMDRFKAEFGSEEGLARLKEAEQISAQALEEWKRLHPRHAAFLLTLDNYETAIMLKDSDEEIAVARQDLALLEHDLNINYETFKRAPLFAVLRAYRDGDFADLNLELTSQQIADLFTLNVGSAFQNRNKTAKDYVNMIDQILHLPKIKVDRSRLEEIRARLQAQADEARVDPNIYDITPEENPEEPNT